MRTIVTLLTAGVLLVAGLPHQGTNERGTTPADSARSVEVPLTLMSFGVPKASTKNVKPEPVVVKPSSRPANVVVSVAKKYIGVPYRRGGTSPRGFDCSGFTKYVYSKAKHKKIPRTAAAQMHRAKRIPKSKAKPGDLVFFVRGRHVYHVGIYAGKGKVIDSPRPGKRVSMRKIWTSQVAYGRL